MFGLKWAICRVFRGGAKFNFCSARKYIKYFPLPIGMIGVCFELYSSFIMEDARAFPCMQHFHVQPETDGERKPFLPPSHLSANSLYSVKSLQSPAPKHQEETQKAAQSDYFSSWTWTGFEEPWKWLIWLFIYLCLFIYLSNFSCGAQDLLCCLWDFSLWHIVSFLQCAVFRACGIIVVV